jgi:hypothetical protein
MLQSGTHERHCGPLLTFRTVWRSEKSKIPHIRGDDNVTFGDYDTASHRREETVLTK